jgi:hypothetical protein
MQRILGLIALTAFTLLAGFVGSNWATTPMSGYKCDTGTPLSCLDCVNGLTWSCHQATTGPAIYACMSTGNPNDGCVPDAKTITCTGGHFHMALNCSTGTETMTACDNLFQTCQ